MLQNIIFYFCCAIVSPVRVGRKASDVNCAQITDLEGVTPNRHNCHSLFLTCLSHKSSQPSPCNSLLLAPLTHVADTETW